MPSMMLMRERVELARQLDFLVRLVEAAERREQVEGQPVVRGRVAGVQLDRAPVERLALVPLPVVHRADHRVRRVRLGRPRDRVRARAAPPSRASGTASPGDSTPYSAIRQYASASPDVRQRKPLVHRERLPEALDALFEPVGGPLVPQVAPAQVQVERLDPPGRERRPLARRSVPSSVRAIARAMLSWIANRSTISRSYVSDHR